MKDFESKDHLIPEEVRTEMDAVTIGPEDEPLRIPGTNETVLGWMDDDLRRLYVLYTRMCKRLLQQEQQQQVEHELRVRYSNLGRTISDLVRQQFHLTDPIAVLYFYAGWQVGVPTDVCKLCWMNDACPKRITGGIGAMLRSLGFTLNDMEGVPHWCPERK